MTEDRQPDLFDWSETVNVPAAEPSAEIIAFPVDERAFHVRMVARQLRRRLAKGGPASYARALKTEKNRMRGRLQVEGFQPIEISMRLQMFERDIDEEMERSSAHERILAIGEGGAA